QARRGTTPDATRESVVYRRHTPGSGTTAPGKESRNARPECPEDEVAASADIPGREVPIGCRLRRRRQYEALRGRSRASALDLTGLERAFPCHAVAKSKRREPK